jgi:two-component system, cell cycle response regulator
MRAKEDWPKLAPQKILVVDDEQQVCDLLAEALSFMGHEVLTARDGVDALERMDGRAFSVVVTDMDMPRMDGMELIKQLVEDHVEVDIIAITGHTMKYKYTDVIAAGAADFITKPFTLNELEAKLNRLIRERCLRQELELLAVRDHLTGLYNRRSFQKIVRKEAVRAMRYSHPLFLFFFDIDHFKAYNDTNGHQAGDELLQQVAEVLRASIREDVDSAFRYGGDEFTVLLPHLTSEQAAVVAGRIQQNYNKGHFELTSLSIGVAQFVNVTGDVDQNVEDMIRRADAALYRVKQDLGGSKICFDGDMVV